VSFLSFMLIGGAIAVLVVTVALMVTRKQPYDCPPDKRILATVPRHSQAGPMLVILEAKGIDTEIVEEPAKALWRRGLLGGTRHFYREPPGPWHVVVPADRLSEAQHLVSAQPPYGASSLDMHA
jgi:hypothetical protein